MVAMGVWPGARTMLAIQMYWDHIFMYSHHSRLSSCLFHPSYVSICMRGNLKWSLSWGWFLPLCMKWDTCNLYALDSYPYLRLFRVMPPTQLLLQTLPVTSVLSWNIDRNVKMLLTTVKSIFVVMPCSVKLVQRSRFWLRLWLQTFNVKLNSR